MQIQYKQLYSGILNIWKPRVSHKVKKSQD